MPQPFAPARARRSRARGPLVCGLAAPRRHRDQRRHGFSATFYFKLAEYAAERGYDALVYDYRGMGLSAPADLASETTRMSDWGLLDMRAALDAGAARAQGLPVVDASDTASADSSSGC